MWSVTVFISSTTLYSIPTISAWIIYFWNNSYNSSFQLKMAYVLKYKPLILFENIWCVLCFVAQQIHRNKQLQKFANLYSVFSDKVKKDCLIWLTQRKKFCTPQARVILPIDRLNNKSPLQLNISCFLNRIIVIWISWEQVEHFALQSKHSVGWPFKQVTWHLWPYLKS